jgi:cell division protein FtsI/penicillin-binding protein 2
MFGRRLHARRPARRPAGLLLLLLVAVTLAGCTSGSTGSTDSSPPPDATVQEFVGDLMRQDLDKAAALTTDPGEAGQLLAAVVHNLAPSDLQLTVGQVAQDDADATVPVSYAWQLPDAGTWTYDTTWTWRRIGSGSKARWSLVWAPSAVHPDLGAGQTIAVRTSEATDGALVDRTNQQLLSPVTVYSVQLNAAKATDLDATATTLSAVLKKFDKTLTAKAIAAGARKADPDVGYTVINLREADFTAVRAKLAGLAGVTTPSSVRDLPPTKDFARQVLAQVTPVAQEMAKGTAGWRIVAIDAAGEEITTLADQPAKDGAKITLTLDTAMQAAAEKALATVEEPAVLVAIQPSTGEILTVAQNAAADRQGSLALTGRYPPGSTFKIVTATAALDRKLITPATQVPCPGEWVVDSRPIRNDFGFDLGTVPATLAFAKSCNTTFARLATEMPADALSRAAKQYGIGLDFVIPGITTLTGQVPAADSTTQAAENGFGQGVVLVTPFSAALMAATAATGSMPTPTLIRGSTVTEDQPAPARSTAAQQGIRAFMRAVVTEGTATLLGDVGTVYAKTGTAEFSNAKGEIHAHAWTVGFRGDLAFSVLIVGGESSKRTNLIAHDFLAAVPAS